jgi:hypothetical protein
MKRLFMTGFIFLFGLSALAAQAKPVIGYDKVPWGTSIEDVKKAYPNLNLEEFDLGDSFPNMRRFLSTGDIWRDFYFYNDKLFSVYVSYGEKMNRGVIESTINVLVERYGKPDQSYHINYSDELRIEINYTTRDNYFGISYVNPKVEKQIELNQVQF